MFANIFHALENKPSFGAVIEAGIKDKRISAGLGIIIQNHVMASKFQHIPLYTPLYLNAEIHGITGTIRPKFSINIGLAPAYRIKYYLKYSPSKREYEYERGSETSTDGERYFYNSSNGVFLNFLFGGYVHVNEKNSILIDIGPTAYMTAYTDYQKYKGQENIKEYSQSLFLATTFRLGYRFN